MALIVLLNHLGGEVDPDQLVVNQEHSFSGAEQVSHTAGNEGKPG